MNELVGGRNWRAVPTRSQVIKKISLPKKDFGEQPNRTATLADFNMEHDSSSSDNEGEMKSSTSISSHESENSPKKCLGEMAVKKRTQKRDQGTHFGDSDRCDDLADLATGRHHNHEMNSMITHDDVHTNHQDSGESTLTDGREIPVIDPTFDPGKSISSLVLLLYFATQTSNASTIYRQFFSVREMPDVWLKLRIPGGVLARF